MTSLAHLQRSALLSASRQQFARRSITVEVRQRPQVRYYSPFNSVQSLLRGSPEAKAEGTLKSITQKYTV